MKIMHIKTYFYAVFFFLKHNAWTREYKVKPLKMAKINS